MLATIDRTQMARGFLDSLLGPLPPDSALEIRRKRNDEPGTRQEFYGSIQELDLSKLRFPF